MGANMRSTLHGTMARSGEGFASWRRPVRLSADGKTISIRVAASLSDLMQVVAIRAAVYMAEQECPYDEEFDGNDFCAMHLIGSIGDEPAGCMRIRFFADHATSPAGRVLMVLPFMSATMPPYTTRAPLGDQPWNVVGAPTPPSGTV